MARRVLVVVGVLVALSAAAPAAQAARRVASPTGSGDCINTPCNIGLAFSGAGAGDEIVITGSDYGSAGSPITTPIASTAANLDVHGVDGQPRPRIFTNAGSGASDGTGMQLGGAGVNARHFEVDESPPPGPGPTQPVAFYFTGATASDVVIRLTSNSGRACTIEGSALLRDSVCEASGANGIGIYEFTNDPATNNATIRNVTAAATQSTGTGIEAVTGLNNTENITVTNAIVTVPGSSVAVEAYQGSGGSSKVTLDHSSYGFQSTAFTSGMVVDNGGNQRFIAPRFAGPGDYHEVAGSPTIDKGVNDPLNGATDYDGDARTVGSATDIGADEFVPPPASGGPGTGPGGGGANSGGTTNRRCVVPKLTGLSLAAARRKLTRAHCRLGKVRRPKVKKGHGRQKLVVKRQSVKPGANRATGTRVNVTLGPAGKHKRVRTHP